MVTESRPRNLIFGRVPVRFDIGKVRWISRATGMMRSAGPTFKITGLALLVAQCRFIAGLGIIANGKGGYQFGTAVRPPRSSYTATPEAFSLHQQGTFDVPLDVEGIQ